MLFMFNYKVMEFELFHSDGEHYCANFLLVPPASDLAENAELRKGTESFLR